MRPALRSNLGPSSQTNSWILRGCLPATHWSLSSVFIAETYYGVSSPNSTYLLSLPFLCRNTGSSARSHRKSVSRCLEAGQVPVLRPSRSHASSTVWKNGGEKGDETVPPTHKELKEARAAKTGAYCLCESSVSDLNPKRALTVTSAGEKLNEDGKCFEQSWQRGRRSRTDVWHKLSESGCKNQDDTCVAQTVRGVTEGHDSRSKPREYLQPWSD